MCRSAWSRSTRIGRTPRRLKVRRFRARTAVSVVTGGVTFEPFASGSVVDYTQAPGSTSSAKKIGASNGQAGAVIIHITGPDELVVRSVDGAFTTCLVPPPPR